jgi:D-aminoacyl-tRNA deacylase
MSGVVLYSESDTAGSNIAKILERDYGIASIAYEKRIPYMKLEDLSFIRDSLLEGDVCIVASRHRSESGTPSLTVHSPGNYGIAGAGGSDRELGFAPALYLRKALKSLQDGRLEGFEVCLEATHHGPTALRHPMMFVEVGSTEKEWGDLAACRKAALAAKSLFEEDVEEMPVAIGLGGGHYCRKFSAVSDYALGHICAKHALSCLDEPMLSQMIEKTVPHPAFALVEKKGLGKEKARVLDLLKGSGLEIVYV